MTSSINTNSTLFTEQKELQDLSTSNTDDFVQVIEDDEENDNNENGYKISGKNNVGVKIELNGSTTFSEDSPSKIDMVKNAVVNKKMSLSLSNAIKYESNFINMFDSKPRKFGNVYLFSYDRNNIPRIVIGPDYKFFIVGFSSISIYIIIIFFIMFNRIHPLLFLLGLLLHLFDQHLYLTCFLINPGIIYKRAKKGTPKHLMCRRCLCLKSRSQRHCATCGVCVDEYDHHCPWMSKCVGRRNYWYFKGFLMMFCVNVVYVILVMSNMKTVKVTRIVGK